MECSVENCQSPTTRRGLCSSHYMKWYRNGDPEYVPPDNRTRWINNVLCDEETGCHLWLGPQNPAGYGHFNFEYKRVLAHRLAYFFKKGPIAPDLVIDHLCMNKLCVNPFHLEAVSAAENARRGAIAHHAKRMVCKRGHEYTQENTYFRKDQTKANGMPVKECKLCKKLRNTMR